MTKKNGHSGLIAALSSSVGLFALSSCNTALSQNQSVEAFDPHHTGIVAEPAASIDGELEAALAVFGADASKTPVIITSAGQAGLQVSSLNGETLSTTLAGEVTGIDVAYNFPFAGANSTLIGAVDDASGSLRLYTYADGQLTDVGAGNETIGFAAENVCFYRHQLDGLLYAFIVGDGGEVDQNLIFETSDGRVSKRPVRRISVPATIKQCVADSVTGKVYASEELVGIWSFNADPEALTGAQMIDRVDRDNITEEVGGLAFYNGGPSSRYIFASDIGAGKINVYDANANGAYVGGFAVVFEDGESLEEPGQLFAMGYPLSSDQPGSVLIADEDNSQVLSVSMAQIAERFGVSAEASVDPRVSLVSNTVAVRPSAESAAVTSYGDAADDPVIWADPDNPANSKMIGTDKKSGLYVYDMSGKEIQYLPDGKMNNVDLRGGFSLNGQIVTIVTASDRTNDAIAIYVLDPTNGTLSNVANGIQPTDLEDPYGLCMYSSPNTGGTYVFINGDETRKRQWELIDAGNGKVDAVFVRELEFDSQTEGCVADDANGTLYVGEEDVGIWKLGADPSGGSAKTMVHLIEDDPYLTDDVEGLSIYNLDQGGGYLVVSSQGDDTYAFYDLESDEYKGSVAIVANGTNGIDGASETDGLDVSSANLGPGYEHGAIVVQDGRNVMPTENQNFKYVPWDDVADALGLEKN